MNEHSDRTAADFMERPVPGETADAEHGSKHQPASGLVPRYHPCPRWLTLALIATAALVFVAWLYLAGAHLDDRYRLDHVSGARMALAQYFDRGTLYPELYDGRFYGGTRFMPLPIVLHGLTARLTGEYLVSGKLLGYMVMVGLLTTMVVLLRRLRCPLPFALILAALILTTATGFAGSMNMRADVLPLVLQVLAVWIVDSTARPAATVGAAALAALALVSKLSAVWAPIAIVIWLLRRDRKQLALFSSVYVMLSGGLMLLFTGVSDGRLIENVFGLSASGITGPRSVLLAPYRLMHLLVGETAAAWAVIPVAGLAAWVAVQERRGSIYLVSLLCASAVVLIVLTDVGTGANQLIDLVVLTSLVIGEFAARVRAGLARVDGPAARVVGTAVGLALLWVTLSGFIVTLAPAVWSTVEAEASFRKDPLSGLATSRTSVLSEDPYVPISLGQVPVVLDPFMLPRLTEREPDAVTDLIGRIEEQEFDLVILVEPLEPLDRSWWRELDLGIPVVKAISRAYTYSGRVQGYHVYEPRAGGSEP
jgi:hypothetical protein